MNQDPDYDARSDDRDKFRHQFYKWIGGYLISIAIFILIYYCMMQSESGRKILNDNVFVLTGIIVVFLVLYLYIHIKFNRKLNFNSSYDGKSRLDRNNSNPQGKFL